MNFIINSKSNENVTEAYMQSLLRSTERNSKLCTKDKTALINKSIENIFPQNYTNHERNIECKNLASYGKNIVEWIDSFKFRARIFDYQFSRKTEIFVFD